MNCNPPLNRHGSAIVLVIILLGAITLIMTSMTNYTMIRMRLLRQGNVNSVADQIRDKLVNLVISPQAWGATQLNNSTVFALASGGTQLAPGAAGLDIYYADPSGPSGTLYYASSDSRAGFDAQGEPCNRETNPFLAEGSDTCPYRYEIRLAARNIVNGSVVDSIAFELTYRPATPGSTLNGGGANYSFTLARNMNVLSVESSCISLSGSYDTATASCSVQLTRDAGCPTATDFSSPYSGSLNLGQCQSRAPYQCPSGQAVLGFGADGQPVCGTLPSPAG
jgi:hypothetical protein